MKRVVSISIGSPCRDKKVELEIAGESYVVERIGTDGSIKKAIDMIKELDGKVDAFGMGGIDLYLSSGSDKKHIIREAVPIKNAAKVTPIVDGTGVKNTLEKRVIEYLKNNRIIEFKGKKVLVTCAADRFKMAEAFVESGCDVSLGDFIFALGIPFLIKSLRTFRIVANLVIPLVSQLPFKVLYPIGEKQKEADPQKFAKYYKNFDIIAGDFHYIKKYMPLDMSGKIIVTNTVTDDDVQVLKTRGVSLLVTTTPEWDGRSFGTNVIEAVLVTMTGKKPEDLCEKDYFEILEKLAFKPRIEVLNNYANTWPECP